MPSHLVAKDTRRNLVVQPAYIRKLSSAETAVKAPSVQPVQQQSLQDTAVQETQPASEHQEQSFGGHVPVFIPDSRPSLFPTRQTAQHSTAQLPAAPSNSASRHQSRRPDSSTLIIQPKTRIKPTTAPKPTSDRTEERHSLFPKQKDPNVPHIHKRTQKRKVLHSTHSTSDLSNHPSNPLDSSHHQSSQAHLSHHHNSNTIQPSATLTTRIPSIPAPLTSIPLLSGPFLTLDPPSASSLPSIALPPTRPHTTQLMQPSPTRPNPTRTSPAASFSIGGSGSETLLSGPTQSPSEVAKGFSAHVELKGCARTRVSAIFQGVDPYMDAYDSLQVVASGTPHPGPMLTFNHLKSKAKLKENMIKAGFQKPTPIQKYAIPIIYGGEWLGMCGVVMGASESGLADIVPTMSATGPLCLDSEPGLSSIAINLDSQPFFTEAVWDSVP